MWYWRPFLADKKSNQLYLFTNLLTYTNVHNMRLGTTCHTCIGISAIRLVFNSCLLVPHTCFLLIFKYKWIYIYFIIILCCEISSMCNDDRYQNDCGAETLTLFRLRVFQQTSSRHTVNISQSKSIIKYRLSICKKIYSFTESFIKEGVQWYEIFCWQIHTTVGLSSAGKLKIK